MSTRKRSQRKGALPRSGKDKGVDFGLPRVGAILIAHDFLPALQQANIVGTAYATAFSEEIGADIPCIVLIGTNEEALKDAFECFRRWGSDKDGDSVHLSIVFSNDGGYVLVIGPDTERAAIRISRFDRSMEQLTFGVSYLKKIDTRQEILGQIRAYKEARLVSPVVFEAAYHPPTRDRSKLSLSSLKPIRESRILKFELDFRDEDSLLPDSPAYAARIVLEKRRNGSSIDEGPPEGANLSPPAVTKRREKQIRTHFPVTLERLRNSGIPELFQTTGFLPWQVEQAYCNLAFSLSICRSLHYLGVRAKSLDSVIIENLRERYEKADGSDSLLKFDTETVVRQIRLDVVALAKGVGAVKHEDYEAAKLALESKGYLNR